MNMSQHHMFITSVGKQRYVIIIVVFKWSNSSVFCFDPEL